MQPAVVSAHGLSKRFGSKVVLDGITAAAEPGDVIGVLGKNGAGKTTLLEVLLGFSPPSAGTAQVFGENSLSMSEAAKAQIGFVPQQDELVDMLTGAQQLAIIAPFYRAWDRSLIERLCAEWQVPVDQRIRTMSVGERQKLSILLALGHHPALLVLDEPVASLDPIARRAFVKQILDVGEDTDRTVLFSTHIVSDLERAANKIWIIKDGRLAWHGELDALKDSVVRLHVRARQPLPARLELPHLMSSRIDGPRAVLAVSHWHGDQAAAVAAKLDADLEVESLGLEDIFLELHK
jgi:ABC-2 type transport system ATP-binding protein